MPSLCYEMQPKHTKNRKLELMHKIYPSIFPTGCSQLLVGDPNLRPLMIAINRNTCQQTPHWQLGNQRMGDIPSFHTIHCAKGDPDLRMRAIHSFTLCMRSELGSPKWKRQARAATLERREIVANARSRVQKGKGGGMNFGAKLAINFARQLAVKRHPPWGRVHVVTRSKRTVRRY